MYKDEDEALEAAAKAFDAGITYVDSGGRLRQKPSGRAPSRKGVERPARRHLLATTAHQSKWRREPALVEESLAALQWIKSTAPHPRAHSEDDLARISEGGVLEQVLKMRDEKADAVRRHHKSLPIPQCFAPLRAATISTVPRCAERRAYRYEKRTGGMIPNPEMRPASKRGLPVANRKHMGVIAMKCLRRMLCWSDASAEKIAALLRCPARGHCRSRHAKTRTTLQPTWRRQEFQPLSQSEWRHLGPPHRREESPNWIDSSAPT